MIRSIFSTLAILCIFSCCGISSVSASEIRLVEWASLTDTDITPEGRAALSMNEEKWRHAETDHFVYHFTDDKEAETIYINAEVYYKWIKEFFGISEDSWSKKNHIFIFSDENVWDSFKIKARIKTKAPAYTTGWELFIYRKPYWLSPRRSLAHEITHIIMFRFLNGPLPIFLNEGFAQFVSMRALAMQLQTNEYEIRPLELMQEEKFIPLEELSRIDEYPDKADKLEALYSESSLLTRFLILNYGNDKFYSLMKESAKGGDFQKLIEEIYGMDIETLEAKFKKYAIRRL